MKEVLVFDEPSLVFRYSQALHAPHDGLKMFGPYDAEMPSHPKNLSYGVVGTNYGIGLLIEWSKTVQGPILTDKGLDVNLWPEFPGFEAAFACAWPTEATKSVALADDIFDAARDKDASKRAAGVVKRYLDGIEKIYRHDDRIDVIVCVVPDLIYRNCRPKSRVTDGTGYSISGRRRRERRSGQLDLFEAFDPEIYQFSPDFRRQIKARSMRFGIPIQILLESTIDPKASLVGSRGLTPPCDRAWNLGVALYYKAGGKPWKLHTARDGVCYIGIAYRRVDPESNSRSACCAAQMFLDSGDGIVFMGEYGPWYSPLENTFHLTHDAARSLLSGVLRTYATLEGKPLKEVFLHCRSEISGEEFGGFREACPDGVKLVGIRVRKERREIRLFREGTRPVLRGTFLKVSETLGYLWASGFKLRLGTYDGWEVPLPLRIEVQHGVADIEQVAFDILGLTKLNYNTCKLGESEPVTIGYSDAVGEILVSNPTVKERSPKFKFYI